MEVHPCGRGKNNIIIKEINYNHGKVRLKVLCNYLPKTILNLLHALLLKRLNTFKKQLDMVRHH